MSGDPQTAPGRRHAAWRWARDIALALLVFVALQWWFTRDVVRGALPPLPGTLIGSTAPDLAQWRETQGAEGFVLYIWATWCGVCKTIEGNVDAVARDAPVVSVAMQSGSAEEVQRFLAARALAWPTLNDPQAAIARGLGVDAVPTLIFVDRQGQVRSVTQGYTTTLGIRARLAWARWAG